MILSGTAWALAPAFLGMAALLSCAGSEAVAPDLGSDKAARVSAVEEVAPPSQTALEPAPADRSFTYEGELTQGGFIRGTVPDGALSVDLGDQQVEFDAATGRFFAAFDRDSLSALELTAQFRDGDFISETLNISPRDWQIQHVNVARRPGGASADFMRRRQPELDAIWNARQRETGATGWTQDFIWPVTGRISGLFGRQRVYRGEPGSYHSGIDIAPGNGVPFVSPADGVVVLARTGFSLEGGLIIIDHGAGLNSAFLHASRIVVEEGQSVLQGQHIGNVGSTGRSTGPHLHWSLKWHLSRLDPLLFTGAMP